MFFSSFLDLVIGPKKYFVKIYDICPETDIHFLIDIVSFRTEKNFIKCITSEAKVYDDSGKLIHHISSYPYFTIE